MDHVLFMQVGYSVADVAKVLRSETLRQLTVCLEEIVEVSHLCKFHQQGDLPIHLEVIVEAYDIRMDELLVELYLLFDEL